MKPIFTRYICLWSGLLTLFLLFNGCERNHLSLVALGERPRLETLEVGVTEAWLKVKVATANAGQELHLYRDGTLVLTQPLPSDTTVMADSLQPKQTYRFRAELWVGNEKLYTSPPLTITTLDTTSDNFQWEINTFGGGAGSSFLQDVAIINENDIWAVGEIHTAQTDTYDSLGNWQPPFNAVHWNGVKWELKRIPAVTSFGSITKGKINAVFAFNSNNVWFFSDAGSFAHWNGKNWESEFVSQRFGGINKIWGSSPTDIFFVGTNGNITHYDGQGWQKIESGTDMPIMDIWGSPVDNSGNFYVLAMASLFLQAPAPKLLQIAGNQVIPRYLPVTNSLLSVWFHSPRKVFVCGGGLHYGVNNLWKRVHELPDIFLKRVRGNGLNDIWVVGDFGIAAHFNGLHWKTHPELSLGNGNDDCMAVKGKLTVAVGWQRGNAVIVKINS